MQPESRINGEGRVSVLPIRGSRAGLLRAGRGVRERMVEPELLDELAADDPRAKRSRRDLRRVNAWMGNAATMARALRDAFPERAPRRIVELGAGDGEFMLRVARRLAGAWPEVELTLVDRQETTTPGCRAKFAVLGWEARAVKRDLFEWLRHAAGPPADAIVANLVLHHFSDGQLRALFGAAAVRTSVLTAVEPRRARLPLFFTRCLWLIGCNAVTRHDAQVSVRAAFARRELSDLWPSGGEWDLTEHPGGVFSHLFVARRATVRSRTAVDPVAADRIPGTR